MLKYIGDFDKLKDYGFRLTNDYEIAAIRPNKGRSSNTFISNDRSVVCWNDNDIQDLIKDGLVIKEEK